MNFIGAALHGYCNGFFGRNCYHDKRVEAQGYDWIVARCEDCGPMLVHFEQEGWRSMNELVPQRIAAESCW